jgi:hypothetical protein
MSSFEEAAEEWRQARSDFFQRRAEAKANGQTQVNPEGPRPLMRERPPADPFPIDALGDVLGAGARAIHDRVRAPLAICAQSVLGAATLAV